MRNSFQIGKLFDISIRIDYTWFVVFALVVLSLGSHHFPSMYTHWSSMTYWFVSVFTALIFFGSVLAHELAHSLVSKSRGVPVQSITLFIFGGIARISDEPKSPGSEFWMALAGPVTSIGIGGAFGALYLATGRARTPPAALFAYLFYINLFVAAFNLIPGFPLDGGRIFRSIVWRITGDLRKATRIASVVGKVIAYLFILWGFWIARSGNWFGGIWIAFIGWFLQNAASSSYRQLAVREVLRGVKISEVMTRDWPQSPGGLETVEESTKPFDELKAVRPDDDLYTVMRQMTEEGVDQLPVVEDGQLMGTIARDDLISFIEKQSR